MWCPIGFAMEADQVTTNMHTEHVVGTCKYLLNSQNNFEKVKQFKQQTVVQRKNKTDSLVIKITGVGEEKSKLTETTEYIQNHTCMRIKIYNVI